MSTGIIQGHSLQHQMDVHKMGNHIFNIIRYADDAVLFSSNENNLQRIVNKCNTSREEQYVSVRRKTKVHCTMRASEVQTDKGIIVKEQEMTFKYLTIQITSEHNLYNETANPVLKAVITSGTILDIIYLINTCTIKM